MSILYKVYKGKPKELVYMTFNIDKVVRKYFMYIEDNPIVEIWDGSQLVGKYDESKYDLKAIKYDIQSIVIVA